MTYSYVEDYEELMGKKPEPAPVNAIGGTVETKVLEPPAPVEPEAADVPVETA